MCRELWSGKLVGGNPAIAAGRMRILFLFVYQYVLGKRKYIGCIYRPKNKAATQKSAAAPDLNPDQSTKSNKM